jgi:hypothetical protein
MVAEPELRHACVNRPRSQINRLASRMTTERSVRVIISGQSHGGNLWHTRQSAMGFPNKRVSEGKASLTRSKQPEFD